MSKTAAKEEVSAPTYQAGRMYRVTLARAVPWQPGIVFRPGGDLRMDGALLQEIERDHPGAVSEVVDELTA